MITAYFSDPHRGQGVQPQAELSLVGLNLTHSWGAQPATATATYVVETAFDEQIVASGVTPGAAMRIEAPGHVFYGVCMSDVASNTSGGKERVLTFHDLREYLKWDHVFCAFNMVENVLVLEGGVTRRRRRYWHILPENFVMQLKTYTVAPYSAVEIIEMLFRAATVWSPWTVRPGGPSVAVYHPDMELYPYLNFDALGGKRLDSALVEISDRFGLVFTFDGVNALGCWVLRWARMGWLNAGETFLTIKADGSLDWPDGAATVDDCRDGWSVNEAPNRVRVLGDRNRWQLINLELERDWMPAWEAFYDPSRFVEYVFQNCTDTNGVVFASRVDAGDPDKFIARQLALARANEITVSEFAAQFGVAYLDRRRFGGRLRADMPCMLYLAAILFRAYRIPDVVRIGSASVPSASVNPVDAMICSAGHNPLTGQMWVDPNEPVEGNGYAIAQGYNLGGDLFERMNPAQFDVAAWVSNQDVWQHVTFHLDDAGDGTRCVLMDQPMVRTSNLLKEVDGHVVPAANATFEVARVRVSLTVEADRFVYDAWTGDPGLANRVQVLNESGLHEEAVFDVSANVGPTNPVVMRYADGLTAAQKAAQIAATALQTPWLVRGGGYRRYLSSGMVGTSINGLIDRVQLQWSAQGLYEEVDFTMARGRNYFEPERDYDRKQASMGLLPGQGELRHEARIARVTAQALKVSPGFLATLYRQWYGLGPNEPLTAVRFKDAT